MFDLFFSTASILLSAHNIHIHGKIKELPKVYLNVCVLELSEEFFRGCQNKYLSVFPFVVTGLR